MESEQPLLLHLLLLTIKPHKELNSSLMRDSLKLTINSFNMLQNTENHMEPKLNTNLDLLNSLRLLKILLHTLRIQLTKLELTNSLTGPNLK